MKTILPEAKRLMKEVDYTDRPIRLIGLTVSNSHNEQPIPIARKDNAEKQLCIKFE
jgi:hypothetical protein